MGFQQMLPLVNSSCKELTIIKCKYWHTAKIVITAKIQIMLTYVVGADIVHRPGRTPTTAVWSSCLALKLVDHFWL
jgi:hypothetical protein